MCLVKILNFPQTEEQINMAENNTDLNADFRLFIARIIYGSVFIVIVAQMILQQLPYQCMPNPTTWLFKSEWRPAISIIASTTVLIGFFLPSRLWSLLTIVVMYGFNLSYFQLHNHAFYSIIWWILFIPLSLNRDWVAKVYKKSAWMLGIFALVNWSMTGFYWTAIPVYSLYLLPFLPFTALFEAFNHHFEPR